MGGSARKRKARSLRRRDGDDCYLCGLVMDFVDRQGDLSASIDHVIPLAADGKNALGNLKLAHRYCNLMRHNLPRKVKA